MPSGPSQQMEQATPPPSSERKESENKSESKAVPPEAPSRSSESVILPGAAVVKTKRTWTNYVICVSLRTNESRLEGWIGSCAGINV